MLIIERSAAHERNAEAIAAVINRAFSVETWFVDGDRTSPADVLTLLHSATSAFFVAVEENAVAGCVYAEQRTSERGYIGLLAVEPGFRGIGIGPRLMARAEAHLRSCGSDSVEITVVDLRTELFPFYERCGYRTSGEMRPFPRASKHPCHLVVMTKSLI